MIILKDCFYLVRIKVKVHILVVDTRSYQETSDTTEPQREAKRFQTELQTSNHSKF